MHRLSKILFRTNRDSDLLVRAGLIHKQSAGLYSFLPLGLRVLTKLKELIRNEMNKSGTELQLNLLLSNNLWKKTERIHNPELFKFDDFLLAPTHEEEITDIVGGIVQSYKDLPLRVFQIGPKFRNEKRPRMGLLRAREFIMKDMYSFDISETEARKTFEEINTAYERIFDSLDLEFIRCDADSGDIGGDLSHEYHIVSKHGEDSLLKCTSCGYGANSEKASGIITQAGNDPGQLDTYNSDPLLVSVSKYIETSCTYQYWKANSLTYLVILPKGRDVNELKLKNLIGDCHRQKDFTGNADKVVISNCLLLPGLDNSGLPIPGIRVGDIVQVRAGDNCSKCGEALISKRGIEIGHTFYLGTKYSHILQAHYSDSFKNKEPIEMGCYGIGVSRLMATIPLVSFDQNGIIWPKSVAPFKICVITVHNKSEHITKQLEEAAEQFVAQNLNNIAADIVIDDRNVGFAAKLNDALLVGYPYILVFGKDYQTKGMIELRERKTLTVTSFASDSAEMLKILQS